MTLPTEDVAALVARLREMADTEVFLHGIENSTVPSALREAATTLSTLARERDSAERALLTVQNAAKTIAAAHGTELEHLRQNARFDHSLRAEVESLRQHNSEMTDALIAAEARIAGLEAALEPFAVGTDIFFSGDADDRTVSIGRWYGGGPMSQELPRFNADIALTVGDLRRAREALSRQEGAR